MKCPHCGTRQEHNTWKCTSCGESIEGGIVFVTSISGSGTDEIMQSVVRMAKGEGKKVILQDVGELMRKYAKRDDPDVSWDRILDASPRVLRLLRALAFQEISNSIESNFDTLHIIDLHLCFRWKVYLTNGCEPYILSRFIPHVRCFINIIEDLSKIQSRLEETSWQKREILELLIWRDEELFLTDLFAGICGRVDSYAVASGEPISEIYRMIWHPEVRKVYLSFPITGIIDDEEARKEIEQFRDIIREFLVVFDPYVSKDYDETYQRDEMKALRKEVGETTVDRDYRFIDQADAVVVYYPRRVASKGVDSEMRHAIDIGTPIYLYSPEDLGGGPFQPIAQHISHNTEEFVSFLRKNLS